MHDDELLLENPILRDLREAAARDETRLGWPLGWPRGGAQGDAASFLARAELDLLGVHHAELARVLARAVRWLERRPTPERVRAFRRRASQTVEAARCTGAWIPSIVERVASSDPAEWPPAYLLARTAHDLDPNSAHAELLARPIAREPEA